MNTFHRLALVRWVLGCLALIDCATSATYGAEPAAGNLRELKGEHVTIVTDLAASQAVDGLPRLFDLATPEWAKYFAVEPAKVDPWRVTAYVMRDRTRFQAAGLIPNDLPAFKNGYSYLDRVWLNDQASDYYRGHLLLHEGTHSFMTMLVGGVGPRWYSEGMAELMGSHRITDGRLEMGYFPRDPEELLWLGRGKIIQNLCATEPPLRLSQIMRIDGAAYLENDPYCWTWAVAEFLDHHPRYRDRFRQLSRFASQPDFEYRFQKLFVDDWAELNDEWQVFAANIAPNYDFARMAIDFKRGEPIAGSSVEVEIAADRGWQSTGLALQAGHEYQFTASGRYELGGKPKPWPCEPGGVTLRYVRGRPRGMLLAAVRPNEPDLSAPSALVQPTPVGLSATLKPTVSGTLYLRVNDAANELRADRGRLKVTVAK